MYYAQINEDNICFAISQLTGEVTQNDMIPIASYDLSLVGKVYNRELGIFEDRTA